MYDYEIVGYALDGECYCAACAPASAEDEDGALFAGAEDLDALTCCACGEALAEPFTY